MRSGRILLMMLPVLVVAIPAMAHTETDYVAVPAGAPVTVTLRPTHGCGESPTVNVAARVPVEAAVGGEVQGWVVSATSDGEGRTVVEWSGGNLPSNTAGEFPVQFTAPPEVGDLLLIPFVQSCADGAELAWIDGDPASENPAPRLLILAPGSSPAATLDDVPADAEGRELLTEVIDTDNPSEAVEPTTTTLPLESTTTAPLDSTTTVPAGTTTVPDEATTAAGDPESGDTGLVLLLVGAGLVVGTGAYFLIRQRRKET